MTQPQINVLFDNFAAVSSGHKLDYPNGKFLGECLSGQKRWVDKVAGKTIAPASGTGFADGYYSVFPAPLSLYFDKVVYTLGANYPLGSLVFYAGTHHGAIWLGDNGNGTHTVYEQNADPDGSAMHKSVRANTRVTGILAIKVDAPAAAPITQGAEPIMTADEEKQAYEIILEREPEAGATLGKRTGWQFINDARTELAQKHTAISNQITTLKAQIDNQNQAITDLTEKLKSSDASNVEKQKALNDAITKLTDNTNNLTATHDQLVALQNTTKTVTQPDAQSASLLVKILSFFMQKKSS